MATLSHIDPVFSNVVGIEAVNEQIMNAALTPGYGDCASPTHFYSCQPDDFTSYKNFVQVIRAVELFLGIPSASLKASGVQVFPNVTLSFEATAHLSPVFSPEVRSAVRDAISILLKLGAQILLTELSHFSPDHKREPLTTLYVFRLRRAYPSGTLTYTP